MQTKIDKRWARPRAFGESRHWGLWLISPWLIGLLIFKLIPISASWVLSLTDFFLLEPKQVQFIGLANYVAALKDPNVGIILYRTIVLALLLIPLQTGASIFIAAALSQQNLRLKNTLRALFFLPSIIPCVAAVFMWQDFVNPTNGWLTLMFLRPLGLTDLDLFSRSNGGQSLFILSTLWTTGPSMLILIGAMQSIPGELHEAAQMDGASRLKRFFNITLPLSTPAIFFTVILNLTAVFGGAILLDRGYTFNSRQSSYDNYIYFVLFDLFKLGSASSLAWVFFIFVFIIVLGLFVTARWWVYFPDRD